MTLVEESHEQFPSRKMIKGFAMRLPNSSNTERKSGRTSRFPPDSGFTKYARTRACDPVEGVSNVLATLL